MMRALPVLLALAALLPPAAAQAQGFRGSLNSSMRYLQVRPIMQDTVSLSRVVQRPDGALEFDGYPVFCTGASCIFYRSQEPEAATALLQDLDVTAWGLGVQGLSATALLRSRFALAGDFVIPRSEENFDAVLAYLELNRDSYRVRLGRQRTLSSLGFAGFDGLEVLLQPRDWLRLQGYGGRSLARGLSESRQAALRGLDDEFFLPDREAILVGGEVGVDPEAGTSLALRYQFDIWSDRGGMLSDRASLTGRSTRWQPVLLNAAMDYDFAFGRIGKAHLTAQLPVAERRVLLEATARRYLPYFELWTIWGFFSPVAYHEGLLRSTVRVTPAASVWAAGGYRRFAPHETQGFLDPLHSDAWRAELGGQWRLPHEITAAGSYRWEGPVGAFLASGDANLGWRPTERLGVSLNAMLFQQAEEFRVGQGTVFGAGGALDLELARDLFLAGGVDLFRHSVRDRPATPDWTQSRGWLSLQIGFGRDPGATRQGAARGEGAQ